VRSVRSFLLEFVQLQRKRKRHSLVPPILLFALIGILFTLAEGSAVAPLIHTLF
jgi:hypothetical protein